MKKEVIELSVKDIVPDEHQPRKYFDPVKIKNLKDSIEKYGVMTPITVEKVGEKYLLVDGERRFRAVSELKLKEVPAVVIAPQSAVDRLIQQFHIQEQHEGWTPVEKATTIGALSKELGISYIELAKMLGVENTSVKRYVAFSSLMEKKEFAKSEINLDFAPGIISLGVLAEKIYMEVLKEPFNSDMKRKLEKAIINQIKAGELHRPSHLTKLKDSFTKEPKSIERFIEKGISVNELFLETKAQGAFYMRNASNNASYLTDHLRKYMANSDVIPSDVQMKNIKAAKTAVDSFLKKFEE